MSNKGGIEIELSPVRLPESADDVELAPKESGNIVEDLLSRIGIGKYHWITYGIISIFWLCDGAEIIAVSLLSYVFVHVVWFRSLEEVSLLGSALFAGFFLGSLISGWLTTSFGRRKPFLALLMLVFILGILSAVSPNFEFLLITRGLYGITVGVLSPLSSSMITEITPKAKRGINFVIISAFFTIGEIIAIFLAAVLNIEEKGSEAWRVLLIWASVPALISFILGLKYLEESPRYELTQDANRGIAIFNKMNRINKGADLQLRNSEYQEIVNYTETQKQADQTSPIKEVLSRANLRITICLWTAWWVLNFVYYGIVYVLPLVMVRIKIDQNQAEEEKIDYKDLVVSVIAELPSYILAMLVIENERFGRKKSLSICFFLAALSCFGAHFFVDEAFLVFIFLAKFFASAAFEFVYPLTAELYNTSCRTTGLGLASAMSRIGGVVMPWVCVWTLNISSTGPFVAFGVFCLVATIAVTLLPYDTTGRELDTAQEK